ncbi:MAG TPA: hypothetical protein VEX86_15540 [Longimicrobium sp.]|nr:hypothetical protein [Longimicrobium sp.]
MDASNQMQVTVLQGAPPQPWSTGTLDLQFQGQTATGTLRIAEYAEPFPLTGSVQFDIMDGARVYVTGQNSQANVEISGVQMANGFVSITYFGGMLNLLDFNVREWIPYILNGYTQSS